MKQKIKRMISVILLAAIMTALIGNPVSAAGKVRLSQEKITISVGKAKKIKLVNHTKTVKWKIKSGKSRITLKGKKKTAVTVMAKKKTGKAVLQAIVGKKTYTCHVTVTKKKKVTKKAQTKKSTAKTGKKSTKKVTVKKAAATPTPAPTQNPGIAKEKLILEVGNQKFEATLYDNKATRAWKKKLPMTLNMSELNRNEKYYYLSYSLPTAASKPGWILTGDLKLFGSDCLVLFYQTFQTSYSYTSVAHINSVGGLQNALGNGSVSVTFKLS